MRILIIEDDYEKREKIKLFIFEALGYSSSVDERESLRSGLKALLSGDKYDLVLLDMSMPNFDIGPDEPGGGTPESFAGKELMAQMKLRNIVMPVLVITQYSTFDGGSVTLDQLKKEFTDKYKEIFVDIIYYNSAVDCWKKDLETYLHKYTEGIS